MRAVPKYVERINRHDYIVVKDRDSDNEMVLHVVAISGKRNNGLYNLYVTHLVSTGGMMLEVVGIIADIAKDTMFGVIEK